MTRRSFLFLIVFTAVLLTVVGCAENRPAGIDIQATIDTVVDEKQTVLETQVADTQAQFATQVAHEVDYKIEQAIIALRTEFETKEQVADPNSFLIATPTLSIGAGASIPTVVVAGSNSAAANAGGCTDSFAFLGDVTFADGTMTLPFTRFDKIWYIQNTGTCSWNRQYKIVFYSGDEVSGAKEYPIFTSDKILKTGESATISVPLVAPEGLGKYTSYWAIKNPAGDIFGAGPTRNVYLSSVFQVGNQYNFYENIGGAICSDDSGLFFCGNADRSSGRGVAYYQSSPTMESNYAGGQAIIIGPPATENGTTRVAFGPVRVRRGTWLRSAVSCPPNSPLCDNFVRLYISPNGEKEQFVCETHEVNDGLTSEWNVSLSNYGYHDQDLTIIFEVQANGGSDGDDLIIFNNPRLTDIPPQK